MTYKQSGNKVVLKDMDSFNLDHILNCGQCFRFTKLGESEYIIIAFRKILHITQSENEIIFSPCNMQEFEEIWIDYFDLNTDYSGLKEKLAIQDEIIKEAVHFGNGIRILNQEPWECIISFIISQNSNIPRIKQTIKLLCEKYGDKIEDYYCFPTPMQMKNVTEDDLRELKTGFRAKYIFDAIQKITDLSINIEEIKKLPSNQLMNELQKINGIGPKVANCIMIFSFGRRETFPIDVWVKRVMEYFYFEGNQVVVEKIKQLAEKKYGDYAGYAQQYLFFYAREQKIGK